MARRPSEQDRRIGEQREQSLVDAAWEGVRQTQAGVRQAWRAVTVSILAARVGLVSSVVAVIVPYEQRHLDQVALDGKMHEAKVIILPEVLAQRDELQRFDYALRNGMVGPKQLPATKVETRDELASLEAGFKEFDAVVAEEDKWVDKLPRELSIVQTVDVMQGITRGIEDQYRFRRFALSQTLHPGPKVDALDAVPDMRPSWPPESFNTLLLLIYLNVDEDDRATAGPYTFASCDDRRFFPYCFLLQHEWEARNKGDQDIADGLRDELRKMPKTGIDPNPAPTQAPSPPVRTPVKRKPCRTDDECASQRWIDDVLGGGTKRQ